VIRHASIYEARQPQADDGWRVLVMRQWPRGIRKEAVDLWLKDAAPSRELLQAYHHGGLPWSDFEARYRAEILEERPEVLDQIHQLEIKHGTVTLLCFERIPPAEHCHRIILVDLVTRHKARAIS
jgi:uncharacterized protein YeaO (DUF488 family)